MLNKRLDEWEHTPLCSKSANFLRELNEYFYKYIPEDVEEAYEKQLDNFINLSALFKTYEEHLDEFNNYEKRKKGFCAALSTFKDHGDKIKTCIETVDGFSEQKLKEYEDAISQISIDDIEELRIRLISIINFLALSEKGATKDSDYKFVQEKMRDLETGEPSLMDVPQDAYTGMIVTDMSFYDDNCLPGYSVDQKWLAATLVRTYVDFKIEVYKAFKEIIPQFIEEFNKGNINTYSEMFTNDSIPAVALKIFIMNQKLESMYQGVVNMLATDSLKENDYPDCMKNIIMTYINQLKIMTRYFKTGTLKIDNNVEWWNVPDENISYLQRVLESKEFSGPDAIIKLEKKVK